MGHYINGFIASANDLPRVADELAQPLVCRLAQDLCFVPLNNDRESLNEKACEYKSLERLTQPLAEWAIAHSSAFKIAYIETEYFGGAGGQSAIVWEGGKVVFGPVTTGSGTSSRDAAINRALRLLGAKRDKCVDEFAAVGLEKYRSNEDWIAFASERPQ